MKFYSQGFNEKLGIITQNVQALSELVNTIDDKEINRKAIKKTIKTRRIKTLKRNRWGVRLEAFKTSKSKIWIC